MLSTSRITNRVNFKSRVFTIIELHALPFYIQLRRQMKSLQNTVNIRRFGLDLVDPSMTDALMSYNT